MSVKKNTIGNFYPNLNRNLNKRHTDITPETLRALYPTDEWESRYYQSLRIARGRRGRVR